MAVTYAADVILDRLQAVIDQMDAGAGAAYLEIGDSGFSSTLATITFADPSATKSGSILTFSGMPKSDSSADASGTAAEARIKDSDGNVVISGLTVGTSGTDIILDSVSITITQTVTLNSGTITHG